MVEADSKIITTPNPSPTKDSKFFFQQKQAKLVKLHSPRATDQPKIVKVDIRVDKSQQDSKYDSSKKQAKRLKNEITTLEHHQINFLVNQSIDFND